MLSKAGVQAKQKTANSPNGNFKSNPYEPFAVNLQKIIPFRG